MNPLRIATFYNGTGDVSNISGFRFACESVLAALLRAPEIDRLVLFGLNLDDARRQRLAGVHLADSAARARCTVVDLRDPAALAALKTAPVDILHEMEMHLHRAFAARRVRPDLPISIGTHGNHLGASKQFSYYLPLLIGDVRRGDSVICASHSARRALQQHLDHLSEELHRHFHADVAFRGQLAHIPYGVDTDFFRPRDRAAARAALGLDAESIVLLSHARLNLTNKLDPAPLLLVFRRVARRHPRLRLLLSTSPNPTLGYVSEKIADLGLSDRVGLAVGLPREQVPLLYAASDIVACLSDSLIENFGLIALEAMACGVPVIASDWAGYRETVAHGETGFLVPTAWSDPGAEVDLLSDMDGGIGVAMMAQATSSDCDRLEQALEQLVSDAELRQRMGEAGRRHVLNGYDLPAMARRHAELWHEMRALATRDATRDAQGIRSARMSDGFAGYPTELSPQGASVELTAEGRAVATGEEALRLAPVAGNPVSLSTLGELLGRVSAGPTPVAALIGPEIADKGPNPERLAQRHLLWLIKQGYVRLSK